MTDDAKPPEEGVPVPDYQSTINELKAANVALTQRLQTLEAANAALDQKMNALTSQKAEAPAAEPSGFDAAYAKALRDLGIEIKKGDI